MHDPFTPLSSVRGPAHSYAYRLVVLATWRLPYASATVLALVPGAGGALSRRQLHRGAPARTRLEGAIPS